jgi:hypothetical protein
MFYGFDLSGASINNACEGWCSVVRRELWRSYFASQYDVIPVAQLDIADKTCT